MKRTSLYFVAPEKVELRVEDLVPPGVDELQVETICTAVSVGTEMLVYRGEAPGDTSLPALTGSQGYPLKYGYCAVGRVTAVGVGVEMSWIGKRVFAFNPHESAFNAQVKDVHIIPDDVSDEDAAFLPNVETAVNLILDGEPRLGERVVVLGQGIVGLLVTTLLARHPLETLIAMDNFDKRLQFALDFGAQHSLYGDNIKQALSLLGPLRADLVYELSGHPQALDSGLSLVGEHGRVVVGSWYGTRRAAADLGGHFHRGRVKIISSQVSQIEPALRGRWDKARRFEMAWKMLAEIKPSRLVTHRFPLAKAADAYAQMSKNPADTLGILFEYAGK